MTVPSLGYIQNLYIKEFKMEQKLFSRYELIPTLIQASSFEVVFIKQNGQERTMKCLFESTRYIEQGIMTVFDLVKEKYRSINFKTLKQIIINDEVFQPTFKGKFISIGSRKEKLLESIEEIIADDISVLNAWSYEDLLDVHDELEQLGIYDLEAVRALFQYTYEQGYFGFTMLIDVIQGNLEFILSVTIQDVTSRQLFSAYIPTPDYINTSYLEYQFNIEHISEYYFEASNGVLQVKYL
jgi:hypothetical protein